MLKPHKRRGGSAVIERMFSTAMLGFVASNLTAAIGPVVDGIIVGTNYGVDEVAAIGLTSFLLVGYRTVTASIISKGAHVIASGRLGAGDREGADRIFALSVLLSLLVAVTLALVSIIFPQQIAVLIGARKGLEHLVKPTADYLKGYGMGLPFFAATFVLTPFLQMDGEYRLVTVSSAVMTIVDVLADLYVVKVAHGGLFQIGLATSLSYLAAFLVVLSHFVFRKSSFRFSVKEIRPQEYRDILTTGMPTGVLKLSNTFCGILINHMLAASFTSEVVAALGVGNQLQRFCFCLWLGAANTLMSFASMFIGEEDREALRNVQNTALRKGLLWTCAAAAVLFLFAVPLGRVFLRNADAAALKMAAEAIRFFALSMPLNVFVYCFQLYLIGVGRKLFANVYSFLLDFGIPVPLTLLSLAAMGYRGAWISKPIINAAVVLLAALYILRQNGAGFREKMLLLPEGLRAAPGRELTFQADSMHDVMDISRTAAAFILENGFDRRKADIVSLAIEEMAGNIVQHGFGDGREHHMDIRIVARDGELILRFRDNCRRFDPVEKYRMELQYDSDPENGIAIKMMMRLVKEIKYTGLYGMNNLIIRI